MGFQEGAPSLQNTMMAGFAYLEKRMLSPGRVYHGDQEKQRNLGLSARRAVFPSPSEARLL